MNSFSILTGFLVLFNLCCLNAFSQDQPVNTLLSQRRELASSGQSYSEIEKQIVQLGVLPPAFVNKSVENSTTHFEFTAYKTMQAAKEEAIEGRVLQSIPGIESIDIQNQVVHVIFNAAATQENILAFFKLFGYDLYETQN